MQICRYNDGGASSSVPPLKTKFADSQTYKFEFDLDLPSSLGKCSYSISRALHSVRAGRTLCYGVRPAERMRVKYNECARFVSKPDWLAVITVDYQ